MDDWSDSELLSLATAVESFNSDWDDVSECLDAIIHEPKHGWDFFSPANCAKRFAKLMQEQRLISKIDADEKTVLEDACVRLNNARIAETWAKIKKSQDRRAQLRREADDIQNERLSPEEVKVIYEREQLRKSEKQLQQLLLDKYMREKEMRQREKEKMKQKKSMQQCGGDANETNAPLAQYFPGNQAVTIDEIIGAVKSSQEQQPAASPLLTSLLKSPNQPLAPQIPAAAAASVHATAPTITNLLTGGAITPSKPAIVLKNTLGSSEAAQLLTRPISGPHCLQAAQTALSPSQSAPTLSMLLERNKGAAAPNNNSPVCTNVQNAHAISEAKVASSKEGTLKIKPETDKATEAANTPMEITNADDADAEANPDSDLLEVFENIGNIDELAGIDVAAVINEGDDFLKSVEEDLNFPSPIDASPAEQCKSADMEMPSEETAVSDAVNKTVTEIVDNKNITKIDIISSDDSTNDDVPLSALGSNNTSGEEKKPEISHMGEADVKECLEDSKDAVTAESHTSEPKNENSLQAAADADNSVLQTDAKETAETGQSNEGAAIANDDKNDDIDAENAKTNVENSNQLTDKSTTIVAGDVIDESDVPMEETGTTCSTDTMKDKVPTISLTETETEEDSCASDVPLSSQIVARTATPHVQQPNESHAESKNCSEPATPLPQIMPTKVAPTLRKLRESPIQPADDDTNTSELSIGQRLRRRYSSTSTQAGSPSPCNTDDSETARKRNLLRIFQKIKELRSAHTMRKILLDNRDFLKEKCVRFLDFDMVRKHIESGAVADKKKLKHELLLIAKNCIMALPKGTESFKVAINFNNDVKEFVEIAEMRKAVTPVPASKIDKVQQQETKTGTSTTKARKKKI